MPANRARPAPSPTGRTLLLRWLLSILVFTGAGTLAWPGATAGQTNQPVVVEDVHTASSPGEPHAGSPAPSPGDSPKDSVVLTVEATDLRDLKGSLLVSVYRSPDGFLQDDAKAAARAAVRAGENGGQIVFHLPAGRYAVAVIHDENDNGKLDTNFMGIPTEGYGVSNNPKPLFRAPRYKEAVFDLPAEGKRSRVSLQYVG